MRSLDADIPRENWFDFCDRFGDEHHGDPVRVHYTVGRDGPVRCAEPEESDLRLMGLSLASDAQAEVLQLAVQARPSAEVTFIELHNPVRLTNRPSGLRAHTADGQWLDLELIQAN